VTAADQTLSNPPNALSKYPLFNARSALDHLAVALVTPTNRNRRIIHATAFPVLINDIDQMDLKTGRYLHSRDRERWVGMTKGIAPAAIPVLKASSLTVPPPLITSMQGIGPWQSSALCKTPTSIGSSW
jgi:hypothetical protein